MRHIVWILPYKTSWKKPPYAGQTEFSQGKVENPISSAKLEKFTNLKAESANVTRWSSTIELLKRYVEITESVDRLKIEGIYHLIPDRREKKLLKNCLLNFQNYTVSRRSNSKIVQLCLRCVCCSTEFYALIKIYITIGSSAWIVGDPDFETGTVKIQECRFADMNENEISATECLKRFENDVEERMETQVTLYFARNILQKPRNCKKNCTILGHEIYWTNLKYLREIILDCGICTEG